MSYERIERQAEIVWEGARKGREAAAKGNRLLAKLIMQRLDRVAQHATCESLGRVARNAAVAIDDLLNKPLSGDRK